MTEAGCSQALLLLLPLLLLVGSQSLMTDLTEVINCTPAGLLDWTTVESLKQNMPHWLTGRLKKLFKKKKKITSNYCK